MDKFQLAKKHSDTWASIKHAAADPALRARARDILFVSPQFRGKATSTAVKWATAVVEQVRAASYPEESPELVDAKFRDRMLSPEARRKYARKHSRRVERPVAPRGATSTSHAEVLKHLSHLASRTRKGSRAADLPFEEVDPTSPSTR
jgi:hypothetical protein